MTIVSRAKDILRPYKHRFAGHRPRLSWAKSFDVLKEQGFDPRTVFDVGVAHGTFELYRAFPRAHYHLIDPDPQSEPMMVRLQKLIDADIWGVGLGDHDGEMLFDVWPDLQGSTFLQSLEPVPGARRVPVRVLRFDTMFRDFQRPALIKIDVQGFELKVLHGMGRSLDLIDVILVEVSLISTLKDGPEAFEVIAFLKQHHFVIADVLGLLRRPLDDMAVQMDLVFVREGSSFRLDRRWA